MQRRTYSLSSPSTHAQNRFQPNPSNNSSTHVVERLARVRDERGDRDNVEQLPVGRLQVRHRVVGRVHVAPERGVNNLPSALQAVPGRVGGEERVGDTRVVDQDVDWGERVTKWVSALL